MSLRCDCEGMRVRCENVKGLCVRREVVGSYTGDE